MTNTLNVTPRITGFRDVLNPTRAAVVVETQDGPRNAVQQFERSLQVELAYRDSQGGVTGSTPYQYDEEDRDALVSAAGVDMPAVWEAAFDSVKESFPLMQDAAAGPGDVALQLRVDMVTGRFPVYGVNQLSLTIGGYLNLDEPPVAYYEMTFLNAQGRADRTRNLSQLDQRIAQETAVANGSQQLSPEYTEEQVTQIREQAANNVAAMQAEKRRMNAVMVGNLSDVLSVPVVSQALAGMGQVVFTERKANDTSWSSVDIPSLMTGFAAAMGEVISAG